MLRDRPGNIVVFTGRNRGKIDRILAALKAGLHVLADKPWIITSGRHAEAGRGARAGRSSKNLAAYDIMTERYEVTCELQREFVSDPHIFGVPLQGSVHSPAIRARSVHHIMKIVAGVPLRRPAWFFDIAEYGEGLADVGTHVVDLVQWTVFPDQPIDYRKDISMLHGARWPLKMTKEQFARVTGEPDFPPALASHVHGGVLDYYCNNSVAYTLRGVHVELEILWNWEAAGRRRCLRGILPRDQSQRRNPPGQAGEVRPRVVHRPRCAKASPMPSPGASPRCNRAGRASRAVLSGEEIAHRDPRTIPGRA